MQRRTWVRRALTSALAVLILAVGPAATPLCAQLFRFFGRPSPAAPAAEGEAEEPLENTFASADRATLQQLGRAREALRQGRYGEALEGLGGILQADDDYFFQPDRKAPVYRSLKAEARRLIGQMPREGRDLYEVRSGGDARAMLQKAAATGDPAGLAKVASQYFHTQAGYEATFLLGLDQLDHDSPLAGALTLKRLLEAPEAADRFEPALSLAAASCYLQAGMPRDAAGALAALAQRKPKTDVTLQGRRLEGLAAAGPPETWLARLSGPSHAGPAVESDRWIMHRGDPARNAATQGSAPLMNLRWRVPVTDDDVAREALRQVERTYRDHGAVLISAIHPLVVDNVVLTRTASTLWAVDFTTGKRIWNIPTDDLLETPGARNQGRNFRQGSPWAILLAERIWDDAAYGTLSSDGHRVFSLEDLSLGAANNNNGVVIFGPAGNRSEASDRGPSNRLVARDIATEGKIKWELGGPGTGRSLVGPQALPQAGTFFLGPPLPLRGQLYVLAEATGEIRLIAIDGPAGNVLWSQQLTTVESITQDPLRRLSGASPSYANGILVCPTGAGSVVAVDLATHSLLWGYRYSRAANPGDPNRQQQLMIRQQQLMMMQQGAYAQGMPLVSRWLDGTATLVEGRVLLTPAEGDALFCLNLADGQPAWAAVPRQDDLYLACVYQGTVVLAGIRQVRAIRLSDGQPAWSGRKVSLPDGAEVAGRGFLSGNRYYLPISTAEVLVIDLDRGEKVESVKSRRGCVPGNLVCYRGRILSQGLMGLDMFPQVDATAQEVRQGLAANPNDPDVLEKHGELLLEKGKPAEAVAEFRRAYELGRSGDSGLRFRNSLRDTLMDGLRDDFAEYHKSAREIEELLDGPVQQAEYLRLMAEGFHQQGKSLHQRGDWQMAIAYYLRLADLDAGPWPLETVDRSLAVRRDRWLQARLEALRWHDGGAEAAAELDRALAPRLHAAVEADGPDALRRFVECFAGQPAAAEARRELVRRLVKAGKLLEAEMLVRAQRLAGDRQEAAALLVDLAELFGTAGRHEAEAACYQDLADRYGDVVCPGGKTGRQWLADLPQDAPARRELRPRTTWPVGEVEVKHGPPADPRNFALGRSTMPLAGDPGPFFADTTVRFDQNRQAVLGCGDLGQTRWEISLAHGGPQIRFGNPQMTPARAEGHLLLMSKGTQILALDPLGISGGSSKLLWEQDMTDASADSEGINALAMLGPFGFQQQFVFRMDALGPVTSRYVCFQRFSNLVAVDPMTGQTLWVREDLPAGSEVFGDDQYIFILPPAQPNNNNPYAYRPGSTSSDPSQASKAREARVIRAIDGKLLGRRVLPSPKPFDAPFASGNSVPGTNRLLETGRATIGRFLLLWETGPAEPALTLYDPWEERPVWPPRKFTAGARAALVGNEAVGVLERDGHFTLLGLPDGRLVLDAHLPPREIGTPDAQRPPRPVLNELTVLRLDDQYFVLAHLPPKHNRPTAPLNGMFVQPAPAGNLFAMDRQGKLQWPSPADIQGHYLLAHQPARLPVLVLASQTWEQRRGGNQMVQKMSIQAIDRRSGRVVYDKQSENPQMMALDLVGNAQQKTVEIRTQGGGRPSGGTVVLHFTDKPITEKPSDQASPGARSAAAKQSPGSVLDALRHALGQPLGSIVPLPELEGEEEQSPYDQ